MYWQGLAFVSEGRLLEKDALIFPGDSKAAQFPPEKQSKTRHPAEDNEQKFRLLGLEQRHLMQQVVP